MGTITKSFSAILFFLFLMSPWPAQAQSAANQPSDKWEFAATPYLWGIGMSGDIEIAGRELDFQASTGDLLKSLDFALMGNFAARRNRWSFALDALHADMGQDVTVGQETGDPAIQNPRLDSGMTIFEADLRVLDVDHFLGRLAQSVTFGRTVGAVVRPGGWFEK